MAWDGIIPSLLSGKIDVVIAGMAATVQRAQTVAFTIPYEEHRHVRCGEPQGCGRS